MGKGYPATHPLTCPVLTVTKIIMKTDTSPPALARAQMLDGHLLKQCAAHSWFVLRHGTCTIGVGKMVFGQKLHVIGSSRCKRLHAQNMFLARGYIIFRTHFPPSNESIKYHPAQKSICISSLKQFRVNWAHNALAICAPPLNNGASTYDILSIYRILDPIPFASISSSLSPYMETFRWTSCVHAPKALTSSRPRPAPLISVYCTLYSHLSHIITYLQV